jgi:uncharacterized protein YsxB (DUF464 family)
MGAPWKKTDLAELERQLGRVAAIAMAHRQKTGKMPLENFLANGKKGIFACFAGRDRLALLPDRTVWGCYLFYDLLGHDPAHPDYAKFCFGALDQFMSAPAKGHAAIAAHYAELRQDYFFSAQKELCCLCHDLESCAVCPAAAALATGTLAMIPNWTCALKKIGRRAQDKPAAAVRTPVRRYARGRTRNGRRKFSSAIEFSLTRV